jgi:two-component system OmpR family sensor kinase
VGLVLLVAVSLVVADVATYAALDSFLVRRVDQQLIQAQEPVARSLGEKGPGGAGRRQPPPLPSSLPGGTYFEVRLPDGLTVQRSGPLGFGGSSTSARPVLPAHISTPADGSPGIFTVPGSGGVDQYRVLAFGGGTANVIVLAIPLTDVDSTLRQLLILEGSISLGVLIAMIALAWFIIQLGLDPLKRIEATAQSIAAGDLSRRVTPATQRTEVGRLGLALNTMLGRIESAFAEKTESERRLRRFVADASHELRTPLTSIRGYAELFRRGAAAEPDEVALAMRRIEDEATRMGVLVEDLLLLARLDQGRPLERGPVDLVAVVSDACTDARAVDPNREITCDVEGRVIVTGDEPRLRQVVANLVRNALVHTPPATPIQVRAAREDGNAVIVVVDHGPGLPDGDPERLFEPFYRADPGRSRDRGGTGLGLSIAARVVAAHGGTIQVSGTPGGGATFRVELPLAGKPEAAEEKPVRARAGRARPARKAS